MAHFAKLDINNIVERIEVVNNDVATSEQAGIDFLKSLYGSDTNWKQTSYNTRENSHSSGGTPFRKNFARIGGLYDSSRDAFIPKRPSFNSWVLNEDTCIWEAPVPMPLEPAVDENNQPAVYSWDEDSLSWIVKSFNPPSN